MYLKKISRRSFIKQSTFVGASIALLPSKMSAVKDSSLKLRLGGSLMNDYQKFLKI